MSEIENKFSRLHVLLLSGDTSLKYIRENILLTKCSSEQTYNIIRARVTNLPPATDQIQRKLGVGWIKSNKTY